MTDVLHDASDFVLTGVSAGVGETIKLILSYQVYQLV